MFYNKNNFTNRKPDLPYINVNFSLMEVIGNEKTWQACKASHST